MPLALTNVPPTAPEAVSPKVSRPAWAVLALAALASILEAVTPEMLAFLGDWKGAAYLVVGVVLQFVVGYKAPDPAREGGTPTETAPVSPTPTEPTPDGSALSVVG